MANDNKDIWIKRGYEIFAISGQVGLKIEPLAKIVGKSKSSFYHHFADLDIFIDQLLQHHIEQSYIMANKECQAENIEPELINVLVDHKIDLLFNRQLRFNRNNKVFLDNLVLANKVIGDAFINVWVKDLALSLSQKQIAGIYTLALENFYLQINEENINYEWLSLYFRNLKEITKTLIKSQLYGSD